MKPSFALNFSDDSIGFLHRTTRGWLEIGSVSLDEQDLGQALAYLRGSALGLEPRGITTKLVIPNSQIRYMSLPAPGPDAASRRKQIKAGLEGKTPYGVDDLVFDWSGTGATVQVAVVARETLDEAEAFARDNRLNPVSFVAIPEAGSFAGEPWFGPTKLAGTLLAPGEKVERDQDPVRVVGRAPRPDAPPAMAETAPETEIAGTDHPSPDQAKEFPAAPAIETEADVPPSDPIPASPPVAEATGPVAPPETVTPEVSHPEVVSKARKAAEAGQPTAEPIEPPAAEVVVSRVTDSTIPPEAPVPPADASAPVAPQETSGPHDLRAPPSVAAPPAAGKPSRAPAPKAPVKAPDPRRAGPRLSAIPGGGGAAAVSGAARLSVPEAEWPLERVTAGARTGKADVSRNAPVVTAPSIPMPRGRKFTVVPPAGPVAESDAPAAEARTEAEAMTVFGARKSRQPGKPRYLFLILVVILLACLAAAGLWSSIFLAQRDSANTPALAANEDAAPPSAPVAEAGDTAQIVATPDPVSVPDPAASGPAAAETAASEAAPDADPAGTALPVTDLQAADDTVTAATTPEPAAQPAPEPQPEPAPIDSASVASAGAETAADRNAGSDPQDEIFLSLADRPVATADAVALAAPAAASDAPPQPQTLPPPFGTLYQFDAEGRIVPTAEGIVTPEGVLLVAGKPPRVPPARPDLPVAAAPVVVQPAAEAAAPADGETLAEIASETPAEPVEAAPFAADPALAGARPRIRPANLVPAAVPEDDASIPTTDDARLSSLKPRARPAALFAEGEAALAAQTADASEAAQSSAASLVAGLDDDGSNSSLAVAVSRKPAPRPASLDRSIEAAVQLAAADASLVVPSAPLLTPPEPASAPEPAPAPAALKPPEAEENRQAEPERDPDAPGESAFTKNSDDPALVEHDEPETGGSAPAASARSVVAKQATVANALNMSKTSLIGIYGSASNRYAMVRQSGGRFVKVGVGDRIDGGRVAAISDRELSYVKNGQTHILKMPRG